MKKSLGAAGVLAIVFTIAGFIAFQFGFLDTESVQTNVLEGNVPVATVEPEVTASPQPTKSAKEVYEEKHTLPDPLSISIDESDEVLGDPNAPITVIEFSDYQCPFCQSFFENTLPQIKKNYIETGKVKFVYKDLPLPNHKAALPAAFATRCAANQGKFWEMHDMIFNNADNWLSVDNPFVPFREYAQMLGLSVATYDACVSNQDVFGEIESDIALAQIYGVQSTPTFMVNGYLVPGAQSYEVFSEIFETLLAENQ